MTLTESIAKRNTLLSEVGSFALSSQFPEDFEVYVVALELVNSSGETLRYFMFPVMPSTIDEGLNYNTNIKKTFGGISVLSSPTFVPSDITLSGSFGRRMQVLLGDTVLGLVSSFRQTVINKRLEVEFDSKVKTGYGSCKILQSICEEARSISGGPKTLILYNLALGNSYIVRPGSLRFTQSQESNMIWNYSLPLKSVAPLSTVFSSKDIVKERARLAGTSIVQKDLTRLTSKINRLI